MEIRRGDRLSLTYTEPDGDTVEMPTRVPGLDVYLPNNAVVVHGNALAPTVLRVQDALSGQVHTASLMPALYGSTFHYFQDTVLLDTGDMLSVDLGGETMALQIPRLTARLAPDGTSVSGEAPPGADLLITLDDRTLAVTAGQDGAYLAAWPPSTVHNGGGTVIYRHPGEYNVHIAFARPHVAVRLGSDQIEGVAINPGPATATLRDAAGAVKGGVDIPPESYFRNQFYAWLALGQEPAFVQPGDTLTVESAGSSFSFNVPLLTVALDRLSGIVSGRAPVGGLLEVTIGEYVRRVPVNPDGAYAMDWSDVPLLPGAPGTVTYTDAAGNKATLEFGVPDHAYYFPQMGG
jgi:hypothetical protein